MFNNVVGVVGVLDVNIIGDGIVVGVIFFGFNVGGFEVGILFEVLEECGVVCILVELNLIVFFG